MLLVAEAASKTRWIAGRFSNLLHLDRCGYLRLFSAEAGRVFKFMALDGAENGCSMTSSDSKIEKFQTRFEVLSEVASSLNTASDEMTKVVGVLDDALRKLNIGLTVWVTYTFGGEEGPAYDLHQIGYTKLNGKWGIALRRIWGNEQYDSENQEGPWIFSDAPRNMRLHGVDKLSELIEELGKEGFNTARKVQEKTKQVRELAEVIEKIANPDKMGTKPPAPPALPPKLVSVQDLIAKRQEGVK
jgi:hypothetical protein